MCVADYLCDQSYKDGNSKGVPNESHEFMFSIKKMTHIATKTTWRQRLISIFCTVKYHEIISIFFEREKKEIRTLSLWFSKQNLKDSTD